MVHVKGTSHESQLKRIKRIEGQVRGIGKMVEEQRYCIDIITQIKAIKSALSSLEINIVESHINDCVITGMTKGSAQERERMLGELLDLMKRASS